MAILCYDYPMIAAPPLLVPGRVPDSQVDLITGELTRTLTATSLPGTRQYWENGIKRTPRQVEGVSALGSSIGPVAKAAFSGKGIRGSQINVFPGGLDYAIGVYAKPVSASARHDVCGQGKIAAPAYEQRQLGFNSRIGSVNAGYWTLYSYDSGYKESATSASGRVDGKWHTFLAVVKSGINPELYLDGVEENAYYSRAASTSDAMAGNTDGFYLFGSELFPQTTPDPIALGCVWSPAPPLALLLEWARNPSSIFKAI